MLLFQLIGKLSKFNVYLIDIHKKHNRQFNFSLFGSEENKLDGSDSRATIIDTGDGYAMIEDRKKDKFLTAGLGYTSLNNSNNSQLIFNIFTTQNEQNDMNSSLLSFTYNKKF